MVEMQNYSYIVHYKLLEPSDIFDFLNMSHNAPHNDWPSLVYNGIYWFIVIGSHLAAHNVNAVKPG